MKDDCRAVWSHNNTWHFSLHFSSLLNLTFVLGCLLLCFSHLLHLLTAFPRILFTCVSALHSCLWKQRRESYFINLRCERSVPVYKYVIIYLDIYWIQQNKGAHLNQHIYLCLIHFKVFEMYNKHKARKSKLEVNNL